MRGEKYTISCLIMRGGGQYYTGNGWDNDIGRACLYAAFHQAGAALRDLLPKHEDAVSRCLIQNKSFDYYNGKEFVYDPSKAKLYTFEEAEFELSRLHTQKK